MDKYQETIQTFDAVAKEYWLKFKDFKPYQPSYDWFCESLPKGNIEMLEVACGPGNVSHYVLNKNPDINLLGIDKAPQMVTLAQKHNPEAEFKVMDCLLIKELKQNFDAIMCAFCLPYLNSNDALTLISAMINLLKPHGVLYISTTSGNQANSGFQHSKSSPGSVYVHYHDIKLITQRLEDSGMRLIKHEHITHVHNEQKTTDEFILAVKKT